MEHFEVDYAGINDTVRGMFERDRLPDFSELVDRFFSGEFSLSELLIQMVKNQKDSILYGFYETRELLFTAVCAAVFVLLAKLTKRGQAAETGFYVTYMVMLAGLMNIFFLSQDIVLSALERLLDFLKALLPVYTASVTFSSGGLSAVMVSQTTFFAIFFAGTIFRSVILPVINIYFLLSVISKVLSEDILSRLSGMLLSVASVGMKLCVAIVLSLGALKGMVAPAADSVKRSVVFKAAGAIPGVGDLLDSAAQTVLGTGLLLKNAIGAAGIVVLVLLCITPFLQLMIATLSLKLSAAVLQPISDKRLIDCMSLAGKAHKLLLELLLYVFFMFLCLILLLTILTGRVGG